MEVEAIDIEVPARRKQVKQAPPSRKMFAVVPIRALEDRRLTDGSVRTLAKVCSWANRAGITWVSMTRIAAESGVRRQVIHKHMTILKKHGYIEVIKRGFRGFAGDTIRIVYDPQISAMDAISIASKVEDARPPFLKELEKKMQSIPPKKQQQMIADMIAGVVKPVANSKPAGRHYNMPADGETAAVKRIRAGLKKRPHSQSKSDECQNSPHSQLRDCINSLKTRGVQAIDEVEKEVFRVMNESIPVELSERLVDEVMSRYAAEGITSPRPMLVAESVLAAYTKHLENALGLATGDERGAG